MTRAPPLSGRRHIFVTFAAAVSLWRFSVCAFVGLRIEGSMNACMELVGFGSGYVDIKFQGVSGGIFRVPLCIKPCLQQG